jgi:hypothetical protein
MRPAEKVEFPGEGASHDPYRLLAQHYAPFVAQETWFQPKSDYLARFDLDGDWRGDNNWANAGTGASQAYVYYAAVETQTHWFLIYNFFHPRDYSDKCVVGTCHENDNEGLILTVEKDDSQYGRLLSMETLAHNNIYSHRADSRVRAGVHNLDGDVEFYEGSHPVVFIESGGHGVLGSAASHSLYTQRAADFSGGTGVTYVYKGRAEKPKHANDRMVGYELLPIYDHWWLPSVDGSDRGRQMFDAYYQYAPYGGRPTPGQRQIAGSFLGRMHGANKAKPFWGWHDNRTSKREVVAPGQWGLDPAYSVNQNLRMPQPFSLEYVFNPYLGIGRSAANVLTEAKPAGTVTPSSAPSSGGWMSGPMAEFRPKHSGDYNPNASRGQFDLRFHVDHTMVLYVQGDVVRYEFEGQQPRDDGSEYSQPIPRAAFARFELEQKDGRGDITLLERPTPENDYTAKLTITDTRSGDDRFHARLIWETAGAASAASPTASSNASRGRGSSVLSRHMEDLLKVTGAEPGAAQPATPSTGAQPAAAPVVASLPPLPGVELSSSDNDPGRYNNAAEGVFEFRGRVDGAVLFRIQGSRVFAEAEAGRPAEVERFSFSQPLPSAGLAAIDVQQHDGRGEVVLLERPWQGNNFTAVVRVSDPRGGDDRYHFRLEWRR